MIYDPICFGHDFIFQCNKWMKNGKDYGIYQFNLNEWVADVSPEDLTFKDNNKDQIKT